MKIQSTTTRAITSKKKSHKSASGSFDALFTSQSEAKQETSPAPSQDDDAQQPQQQQHIEQTLQSLEEAIVNLASNTQSHEQVQKAIIGLRDTLQQSNLSPQDLLEADTLLAVEAKRLETLKKYK